MAAAWLLLAAHEVLANDSLLLLEPARPSPASRFVAIEEEEASQLRLAAQTPITPQQPVTPPQSPTSPATAPAPLPTTYPNQPAAPATPAAPFVETESGIEELPPGTDPEDYPGPIGVRPYGGGHPTDWSWGCGGSPYRTYGTCDNWKVGPRWHVTVDGIVMSREDADLNALANEIEGDLMGGVTPLEDPVDEQFDFGRGGRVTFTSQVPRYIGYQMQFAYEGIEEWNSSIVYEKQDYDPIFFSPVITTTTTTTSTPSSNVNPDGTVTTITTTSTSTSNTYALGPLPLQPPAPFPEGFEQRRFHYRSSFHSGELNVIRGHNPVWRPYCGVRYIKFDDEINDFVDQQAQPPLPFAGPDPMDGPGQFLAVATTDRLNLFDIQNDLVGFQIGLMHDSWKLDERFAFEGFVNAGVYHNQIKFTNLMGIFTTQVVADDTSTIAVNEARTDVSNTVNNDVREYSEIAYTAEASLSGVCRLNKCWALRAGYQCLWIHNVHLAEDAYLDDETEGRSLFFHGWHAGIECRR